MGDKLTKSAGSSITNLPPWLDEATSALTEDVVRTLVELRPDALAIILYGSIARHDERPLSDSHPSDGDLLAIFDTDDQDFAIHQGKALFSLLGEAYNRHLDVLRDVKVMFASRTLREWDPTFVANVAQDGLLLWSRGALPSALASVVGRTYAAQRHDGADGQISAG